MWKHVGEMLGGLSRSIREARRSMVSGPSASERRIVATMHRDSIRRELANRSVAAQVHEDRQEQAYWQLWRLVRSAHVGAIPPQILDASIPDHVTLALSVVADFDEAREEAGSFEESLYRPVSSLPYSPAVIRKCCEFLISIADSPETSFSGDRDLLVKERDALGLALFSLDYFLDLPASFTNRQIKCRPVVASEQQERIHTALVLRFPPQTRRVGKVRAMISHSVQEPVGQRRFNNGSKVVLRMWEGPAQLAWREPKTEITPDT